MSFKIAGRDAQRVGKSSGFKFDLERAWPNFDAVCEAANQNASILIEGFEQLVFLRL